MMMPIAHAALYSISAIASNILSPSRNTCVKKVAPSRYRYEPYNACVLACNIAPESPSKYAFAATAANPSGDAQSSYFLSACASSEVSMTAHNPYTAQVTYYEHSNTADSEEQQPVVRAPVPRYAFVQFKHDSATFLAPFKIAVGDLVVVEGDRGENIGVVAEITKLAPEYNVVSKVLRKATDKDREALELQRQREAAATASTRALAESLGLHGRVEDAEYQFDMNKLTIFVRRATKSTFVDFRKLQRTLFREFRCRIWCAYMDEVEAAEAAPRCK